MAEDHTHDKPPAPWLLYGAYGYTGELIAEAAIAAGERPILAGRNAGRVQAVADRLGLEARAFGLGDPAEVAAHLSDVAAVLHCAGPFSATSRPMVDACIGTGTHYLDITGEIPVFEACHGRTEEAREAGVTLLPGAGFDVVPSDCLAATLSAAVPDATRLYLAIKAIGAPSRGTAKTMVEGAADGGAIRRNGWIENVPTAYKTRTIPFHDKLRSAMTIPWGDVSTAYFSTGIGNIEVYMAMPQRMILAAKVSRPFGPLLGLGSVQRALKDSIDRRAPGPDEEARLGGRSELWGRVEGPTGRGLEGTLTTPDGYALTVQTALECVRRVSRGEAPTGAVTPSMAFGPRFIEEFEGCVLRVEPA